MKKTLAIVLAVVLALALSATALAAPATYSYAAPSSGYTGGTNFTTIDKNAYDTFASKDKEYTANNNTASINLGNFNTGTLVSSTKEGAWYINVTSWTEKGTIDVAYKVASGYYTITLNILGAGKYWIGDASGSFGVNMVKIGAFVPYVPPTPPTPPTPPCDKDKDKDKDQHQRPDKDWQRPDTHKGGDKNPCTPEVKGPWTVTFNWDVQTVTTSAVYKWVENQNDQGNKPYIYVLQKDSYVNPTDVPGSDFSTVANNGFATVPATAPTDIVQWYLDQAYTQPVDLSTYQITADTQLYGHVTLNVTGDPIYWGGGDNQNDQGQNWNGQ
jgi:hypothetical protein